MINENLLKNIELNFDSFSGQIKDVFKILKKIDNDKNNKVTYELFEIEDVKKLKEELKKKYKNITGVYVFLDEKDIPKYVGESTNLSQRLSYQLTGNNNNSTLVKNIIANREDLDYEFKEEIKKFVEEFEIKELILKNFSKLIIINCDSSENKINFSKALERILIYFFSPTFNKK